MTMVEVNCKADRSRSDRSDSEMIQSEVADTISQEVHGKLSRAHMEEDGSLQDETESSSVLESSKDFDCAEDYQAEEEVCSHSSVGESNEQPTPPTADASDVPEDAQSANGPVIANKTQNDEVSAKKETSRDVASLPPERKAECVTTASSDQEDDHSQTPSETPSSPSGKMHFEFANKEGKFIMKVRKSQDGEVKDPTSSPVTPTKPKAKRTPSGSKKKSTTPRSTGSKQRSKVKSPQAINMPASEQNPVPHKPLMDLRHILKKHEKKREPIVQQPMPKVDFYGSLSAIPFLKHNQVEQKEISSSPTYKSGGKSSRKKEKEDSARLTESEHEPIEKSKLPTREEIRMTAEYDESQLEVWKSMTAMGSMHDSMERPQESLPLRPTPRQPKSPQPIYSPQRDSAVRAFCRPDDWVNRPELRSPLKGYRISSPKAAASEPDGLELEPESPVPKKHSKASS